MHRNNNQSIIKRISKRSIQANKTRNIFAVLAIVLTTFMIATIFSIGVSFVENYMMMTTRTAGTTASIFLNNPTEEQYQKIKELDYIKAVGTEITIGSVLQEDTDISILYYDQSQWDNHYVPAISNIHGKYPAKANEIMLSEEALLQLGITEPTINMEIPLTYLSNGVEKSETFHLSGWFTNYKSFGSGGIGVAFVSKAYLESNHFSLENNGRISISAETGKQNSLYDTLQQEITLIAGQNFETSFDTGADTLDILGVTLIIIGVIVVFIVLSGYLLIYNIMYISVSKDIRFYGMLKTIGTSPKQIKRIVRSQIYRLALFAIPLGLVFSLITSFGLVPMAMTLFQGNEMVYGAMPNDISFHPTIFIGTAVFSFFTVFLSCRKPAKMAGEVSPVEALKYTGVSAKKKKKDRKTTKGGKLYRMAFYNVFREKKRAFLVFTSLFMGTITLLSVNGFLASLKLENFIDAYYPNDFSYQSLDPAVETFNEDFMEELSKIDGITNINVVESIQANVVFDEDIFRPFLKGTYNHNPFYSAQLQEDFPTFDDFFDYIKNLEDNSTLLFGVDESHIENFNESQGEGEGIDIDAFRKGEIAVIDSSLVPSENLTDILGKDMMIKEKNTNKETAVTIGGIIDQYEYSLALYGSTLGEIPAIYVSKAFMDRFTEDAQVTFIHIDVDPSQEAAVHAQLRQMNETLLSADYVFEAKSDIAAQFESDMLTMNILGGGISIILIFIGMLNFINVMLTGVHTRRQELAVLESIGMTKKQIHKMLTFEGLYYALITTAIIMTLGNGILYGLAIMVPKIADYAVFHYPVMLITIVVTMIFFICLTVPNIVYRMNTKKSVTERLQRGES